MNNNEIVEKMVEALRGVEGSKGFTVEFRKDIIHPDGPKPHLNNRNQICLKPGCLRQTYDKVTNVAGARGLCFNCYSNTRNKVARGKYTWEALEAKGLVLPKMSQEEKNKNQAHTRRTFKKKKNVDVKVYLEA